MRTTTGLFSAFILGACHGKDEGTPLPAAGEVEPVELTWAGEGLAASMPSVVRFDSAWHLYYTHQAGSIVAIYHAISEDGLSFEDPSGRKLVKVTMELTLPAGFPETHRAAIVRAIENCKVKKAMAEAPAFEVAVMNMPEAQATATA